MTTLATVVANGALAQSTASQVSEVVVTTNAVRSTGGLAVQTQVAKNQSIVTAQYIDKQVGSVNAAQLVNLLPGVTYSTSDPTGVLSDDLRVHGFDGNHVSVTIDGTPVNDTGNYATFPGEYLTTEVTDRVTVNIGQTEVDSPSGSAIGGTMNIVTKTPPKELGFIGSAAGGSYNYYRGYAELDTGEVGPWGTRAFFSTNYTHSDKYKGGGTIERAGVDFRVYQPLRERDFISIAGTYNSNRAYFYESSSLAQYAQFGRNLDWNTVWVVPGVSTPGTPSANGVGGSAVTATTPISLGQGSDSGQGFWAYHLNPVDFGDIRIQSRFDLSHGFTLTADPYFFYTLANGGGSTALSETDKRLVGNSATKNCITAYNTTTKVATIGQGVDLNGDGDCMDTVLESSPSNTQTHRFGLSTSLLYDLNEHSHFQVAYNLDYGNHRQSGAYSVINQQTGFPDNPFGGLRGQTINGLDGSFVRSRDRFSVAKLDQISLNYIGRYFDNKLHVNLGVRNPILTRNLNQYCYNVNGTSQYCDTIDPAQVVAAYNADVAAARTPGSSAASLAALLGTSVSTGITGAPNFRFPFKQTYHYQKALPNAGASWNFNPQNQVYITYSQGFSAPRTDNLYTSSPQTVAPEITDNYGIGYRFQSARITASVNPWYSIWSNHIVGSPDRTDPTISIDRNVGKVTLYGVDMEAAVRATDELSFYGSISLMKSRLEQGYPVTISGVAYDLSLKGKELVLTPDQTYALRAEYSHGPFRIALQGKYTAQRFVSDVNDQWIPGYTVVDLDAEWKLDGFGRNTRIAVNANNIGNTAYYARATTVTATQAVTVAPGKVLNPSTSFYYTGAPTTVYVALKVAF
ncbi:MAG: TonB-dependent receptor [Caulobacteraceae bacterium]